MAWSGGRVGGLEALAQRAALGRVIRRGEGLDAGGVGAWSKLEACAGCAAVRAVAEVGDEAAEAAGARARKKGGQGG